VLGVVEQKKPGLEEPLSDGARSAGMAELATFSLHPGDSAPDFALPGVDGKTWRLADFSDAKFLVVTFWCNHCPYVQGWEGRAIALAKEYAAKGVQFVMINANDAAQYPDDSFERMGARARAKGYPFPYLRDESQTVAHAYGALVTPHPMLFGPDRRLQFQGRIDDRHDDPTAVRQRYLAKALDAAVAGRPVAPNEVAVLGCSVKWKP
jgi:peroxiredoxin